MTIKRLPYRIRNQINSMVLLGADVNVIQDWLENKGHPRTLKRCYEYINDCLKAGLVYRREFYTDSELEPENSLMFKITLVPFGDISTPSFNQ